MNIEIKTEPLQLNIFGFGAIAANKDYGGTAFKLSGKMWEVIKSKDIKSKGQNIWVYDSADKVFTGVELESSDSNNQLEKNNIILNKYAYFKHIGPYSQIKQAGENMRKELATQGYEITLPYIEIYGHWTADETKSETELIMCLK